MKLSAPIFRLKQRAKFLAREKAIALHQALDSVAAEEGFTSWSLLAAKASATSPSQELLAILRPGDMALLGARPGQGKTVMGLKLIAEAIRSGRQAAFFTLEYSGKDVLGRLDLSAGERADFAERLIFDDSDMIRADHIIERLSAVPRGTVAVVDYLQILDQKRENPDLMTQISALKKFAAERGVILVFISQIDRSFAPAEKRVPALEDVRLPNPLDLSVFDKACFLHEGEVRFDRLH